MLTQSFLWQYSTLSQRKWIPEDKIRPWVKDFIQEWVNKFDKGEPPLTDQKAHEACETAQAFKEAAHLLADMTDEITGLIVAEKASNIYEHPYGIGSKIVESCKEERNLRIFK